MKDGGRRNYKAGRGLGGWEMHRPAVLKLAENVLREAASIAEEECSLVNASLILSSKVISLSWGARDNQPRIHASRAPG
jgi:hypothetical protein